MMKSNKLPLLGSNQDSPDPESVALRAAQSESHVTYASEADPNGVGQSHDFSHDLPTYRQRVGYVSARRRQEWDQLQDAYMRRCVYCGQRDKWIVREHMIPRARGGGDEIENIVPACQRCNSRKGRRTPLEWFLASGVCPPVFGEKRAALMQSLAAVAA